MKTLLLTLLCIPSVCAQVIIFDLGDVLFRQSRFGIARSIGIGKFISYALFDRQSLNIEPLLMDMLDTLGTQAPHEPITLPRSNRPMPQILCDWQMGKVLPHELIDKSLKKIEQLDQEDYFISRREKELLTSTVKTIFDPDTLASNTMPIRQGMDLLEDCVAQGHTLIALSNWDPVSFDLIKEKHQEYFDLFDHILVSGNIGLAKPQRACYEHLLTACDVQPEDCYFIDDSAHNVQGAERCGITGLHLNNGDYRGLRRAMRYHGLL